MTRRRARRPPATLTSRWSALSAISFSPRPNSSAVLGTTTSSLLSDIPPDRLEPRLRANPKNPTGLTLYQALLSLHCGLRASLSVLVRAFPFQVAFPSQPQGPERGDWSGGGSWARASRTSWRSRSAWSAMGVAPWVMGIRPGVPGPESDVPAGRGRPARCRRERSVRLSDS